MVYVIFSSTIYEENCLLFKVQKLAYIQILLEQLIIMILGQKYQQYICYIYLLSLRNSFESNRVNFLVKISYKKLLIFLVLALQIKFVKFIFTVFLKIIKMQSISNFYVVWMHLLYISIIDKIKIQRFNIVLSFYIKNLNYYMCTYQTQNFNYYGIFSSNPDMIYLFILFYKYMYFWPQILYLNNLILGHQIYQYNKMKLYVILTLIMQLTIYIKLFSTFINSLVDLEPYLSDLIYYQYTFSVSILQHQPSILVLFKYTHHNITELSQNINTNHLIQLFQEIMF
uniref:Transmembrane domain-containing protein n=1 Tax=Spironucleus salmonicida TaxID=348837 RepID=V6LPK3_9EUKA|eukprot:EST46612.1 Transmembrane domain-containing protein [Spironucleus salmonicida]